MFGKNFYHGLTRKYVAVFGTMFNDIFIERPYTSENGIETQSMKVPIIYGSQDKLLARVNSDPDLSRQVAAISPSMSFVVGSPYYDSTRQLQSTLQHRSTNTLTNVSSSQFIGVPYNLDFTLYIYADQEEDGLRVLENILPFFTPAISVTVKLIPEMCYEIDVPVVLKSVELENDSWGDMANRRKLIWTLQFTMKAQYSGPTTGGRKVIKVVNVNFNDMLLANTTTEIVTTQPGMTPDGKPTNRFEESIDPHEIEATDDFGYIHTFTTID